jgi:hypothetical protein
MDGRASAGPGTTTGCTCRQRNSEAPVNRRNELMLT